MLSLEKICWQCKLVISTWYSVGVCAEVSMWINFLYFTSLSAFMKFENRQSLHVLCTLVRGAYVHVPFLSTRSKILCGKLFPYF